MSADLIDEALRLLQDNYIFPDKATAIAGTIRDHQRAGDYDGLGEEVLCERITGTFFEISADKHLRLRTRSEEVRDALTEEQVVAAYRERLKTVGYGIAKVERLDGNVGYLDLREIPEAGSGGQALAAAMGLLSHTSALIIDVRRCRGGAPNGVNFLVSYFFPDDETHLLDIYDGATGRTRQFWSLAYLPGERYLHRPVFVLTSDVTFSGAEDLSYTLQTQKRATVVGQTTRGGAHPTQIFVLSPSVEITVPIARSVSPVTATNWEGTGVSPDVAVSSEEAFGYAYRQALLAGPSTPEVADAIRRL
jgi:C-terminal processing protease CtpA/Prc